MPLTWIDVADTAVKIGLGAVVTGVSAYLLAGRGHAHTLARDLATKRIGILESACADAEEYFSYCTHLHNAIGPYAVQNESAERKQTDEEREAIEQAHEGLRKALDARNKARSKISLLGASNALEHLTKFNDTLSKYRKPIAFEDRMHTSKRHSELVEEFRSHKQAFYSAAAAFMKNAGSGGGI